MYLMQPQSYYDLPAQFADGLLGLSGGAAALFFVVLYYDQIAHGLRHVARRLARRPR